jgi:hypothetical protein
MLFPGGDGIQQLRCGIFGRFGRLPAVHGHAPEPDQTIDLKARCVTMRNAADQCALLVPMDTTTMIGATDDQSHRHKCDVAGKCPVRVLAATATPARRLPPG